MLRSQRLFNFLGPNDQDMSEVMVDLWTNFATHHNPTPTTGSKDGASSRFAGQALGHLTKPWEKATKKKKATNYVLLKDGDIVHEKDEAFEERMKFWRDVVSKERILYR